MVEHDPNAKQYILDVSEHGGYPQNCYLIKTIMINHIHTGSSRAPDFETKSYNVIYIYSLLVGFDKSALSHHVLIPKSYSSTDTGLH